MTSYTLGWLFQSVITTVTKEENMTITDRSCVTQAWQKNTFPSVKPELLLTESWELLHNTEETSQHVWQEITSQPSRTEEGKENETRVFIREATSNFKFKQPLSLYSILPQALFFRVYPFIQSDVKNQHWSLLPLSVIREARVFIYDTSDKIPVGMCVSVHRILYVPLLSAPLLFSAEDQIQVLPHSRHMLFLWSPP